MINKQQLRTSDLGTLGNKNRIFSYARMKNASFLYFLSLDGHTKVLQVHEFETVSQVKQRLSVSLGVPGDCFYLTLK